MVRYAKRMEQLTNSDIGDLLKLIARPDIISFAGGLPAAELFPVDQLRQACDAVMEEMGKVACQYSSTEGFPALREKIAERMKAKNNIETDADHILVTSGSQQGLDFSARIFDTSLFNAFTREQFRSGHTTGKGDDVGFG